MRVSSLMLISVFIATPVGADDLGYQDHRGVKIFADYPCGVVISAIDDDFDYEETAEVIGLKAAFEELTASLSKKAMAWGFILGFDTAEGGLHTPEQTTLERLRSRCADDPESTAIDILRGF